MNAEVLAAAGLVSHADRPVKVLGGGDLSVRVFVAADAFTSTARTKIERAGGFVQVLGPAAAEAPSAAPAAEPAAAEPVANPPDRASDEASSPEPTAEDDSQATG